jgi:hypothetical protein
MTRPTWESFAELASAPVTVTVRGRVVGGDDGPEVFSFSPPDRWRVEDDDHRPLYVADDEARYQWADGSFLSFEPRDPRSWISGGVECTGLIKPRELIHPIDDDFTSPAGPVEEVTFLGRPAWRLLLRPPPRKPQAVWQYLDVASGVTLAFRGWDGTPGVGFTAIETGVELPPGTFVPPV